MSTFFALSAVGKMLARHSADSPLRASRNLWNGCRRQGKEWLRLEVRAAANKLQAGVLCLVQLQEFVIRLCQYRRLRRVEGGSSTGRGWRSADCMWFYRGLQCWLFRIFKRLASAVQAITFPKAIEHGSKTFYHLQGWCGCCTVEVLSHARCKLLQSTPKYHAELAKCPGRNRAQVALCRNEFYIWPCPVGRLAVLLGVEAKGSPLLLQ